MAFRDVPLRTFQKQTGGQLEVSIGEEQVLTVLNVQLRNMRADEEAAEVAIGAAFVHETLDEVRAKVRLVIGNKQRWIEFQKNRESRLSVFGCFVSLAYIGVRTSFDHLAQLLTITGDAVTGKARSRKTQTFEG